MSLLRFSGSRNIVHVIKSDKSDIKRTLHVSYYLIVFLKTFFLKLDFLEIFWLIWIHAFLMGNKINYLFIPCFRSAMACLAIFHASVTSLMSCSVSSPATLSIFSRKK
jgi:hypothetical protein